MSEQDYSGHKERPTEPIVKPIIGNIAPLQARIAELEKEKSELMDSDRNNDKTRVPKDQWELLIKAAKKGMADAKINKELTDKCVELEKELEKYKPKPFLLCPPFLGFSQEQINKALAKKGSE